MSAASNLTLNSTCSTVELCAGNVVNKLTHVDISVSDHSFWITPKEGTRLDSRSVFTPKCKKLF